MSDRPCSRLSPHPECRRKNRYGYGEWTCFASPVPEPPLDVERLAEALHAMGDACGPFTDDHPAAMHNSQAAAILAIEAEAADAARREPPLDVERLRRAVHDTYLVHESFTTPDELADAIAAEYARLPPGGDES